MHEEKQYLDIAKRILEEGDPRNERTGTGARSLFGEQMRFSLRDNAFPLLTTKSSFFRGIVEELLWFIRGDTDSNKLSEKRIRIWEGNSTRDFLDKRGLDYPEGFIGPGYGWQWRNAGANYEPKAIHGKDFQVTGHEFENDGIDQLANVIDRIKNNPSDRRMLVDSWNVSDIDKMALPPCHVLYQFWVNQAKGELHCKMYQRSADWFLGVPFNIASYAALTILIAKATGLKPGEFIMTFGDCHIYNNHVEQMKTQIARDPYEFPKLFVDSEVDSIEDIENLTFGDFELSNYEHHPALKGEMAV